MQLADSSKGNEVILPAFWPNKKIDEWAVKLEDAGFCILATRSVSIPIRLRLCRPRRA
jgi:hypothetical protein